MTKNRFLSKRLACLLTTALITTSLPNLSFAADGDAGGVELASGVTRTTSAATGLSIVAEGAVAITIAPAGADLTFGTSGDDDAVTINSAGTAATTLTLTDTVTASIQTVIFAGDIELADELVGDTLLINSTNANVTFQNNVFPTALSSIAITAGTGGNVIITVDNLVDEAQTINATIDKATAATNTVTLNITETAANTAVTTFNRAIGGTRALDAININPTNNETVEVKFQATVNATTITLGNATDAAADDTTVTFEAQTANFTVTGTINNAVAADETTINITDATAGVAPNVITFASNIGSIVPIDIINVGSATEGGHAIFSGNVSATAFNVLGGNHAAEDNTAEIRGNLTATVVLNDALGTATLTASGTSAQTVTGTINAATDGEGKLSVTNTGGTVTFASAIGAVGQLGEIETSASTTTIFSSTIDTALFDVAGKVTLSENANTVANITLAAGGTLIIDDTVVNGETLFAGGANITADSIAGSGNIKMPANLLNGQTIIFAAGIANVDATNAAIVADVQASVFNTALRTYTVSGDLVAETIVITAADNSASTVARNLGTNVNKGTALIEASKAAAGDAAALDAFSRALNAEGGFSATEDTKLANQVAPQTDTIAGSAVAAKAVTSGVQNIMSTRLASLRSGDAYSTGVVTGSGMSANSGFIQAFGSTVEQKNKGNEFGYDADTTGFALGFDGKVSDGVVVGISYANSKTDVDGKGTGKAKNDIKTNSGSIYADYTTKGGYVEGSITYGKSDNKGSRIVDAGGLNRTYKSDYDSEQYSFRLSGGIPQSLGGGAFFTPFAAATISQIKADAYTETSTTANDALRLRVAQDTVDSQVGTIGIKYHQAIKDGKTTFTPEVKLALNQEFGDDKITSTNTYQGGGTSFKNSTEIEKTSATAGVGLNISADNVSFNIGYEADAREKYLGHSAQAKITAKF